MKAVLISIRPKWCELIASGKKTIEVRKNKPKIETPFKCYIYCTDGPMMYSPPVNYGRKMIIGEFVCDAILPMSVKYSNPNHRLALREYPFTCLTERQIMDYLGNGKEGCGWHISDLAIYDKPKELSEFFYACDKRIGTDCSACLDRRENKCKPIKRPPQSWCYVEEAPHE